MSKALIEKILRAREQAVTVGERTFTIRRPTSADMVEMEGKNNLDYLRKFVVGWNLQELDVVPGGGAEPIPYDAEVWAHYLNDRQELWAPLGEAIIKSITDYAEARKVDGKN